jgi:putative aldouronate transport system permease protein
MSVQKKSRFDFWFDIVINLALILAIFVVTYPIYFIIIASISDSNAVNNGLVLLLPKDIQIESYKRILEDYESK